MTKIVAVTNQKGGVGKTTTAVNLSACVAMEGYRVLLIDCDPQGNASSGLGINRRKINLSIYDLLINEGDAGEVMKNTSVPGLNVIPSNIQLAGAEVELADLSQREYRLRRAIKGIRQKFDYIFLDCPPSLGLLTINALTAANSVLIPLQCEYYALEGLSMLVDTVNLVKRRLNPALVIEGIVFTMFDARTNLSIQVVEEVKNHFRKEVYQTIIPRNIRLSEAPSHGIPIVQYDPKSKGAELYKELAMEVLQRG